jgi:hypothetical protein
VLLVKHTAKILTALAITAVLALEVGAATPTPTPLPANLRVEQGADGLDVAAQNASLEDVLDAIAEATRIEVAIQRGIERPPVNVEMHDVSVEEALRRVLRRRNYALMYRSTEDGALEVERVSVLNPRSAPEPTAVPRGRWRSRWEARRAQSGR